MRRQQTQKMILYSMLIALTFVMAFTPYLGYITVGIISFTTMHIIVLVAAYLLGIKGGAAIGLAFGITSYIQANLSGVGMNILFINPLVSILPRLLFGFICGLIGEIINTIYIKNKSKKRKYMLLLVMSAGLLTILHTLLVINVAFLFESRMINNQFGMDYVAFFSLFIAFGVIFEIGAAVIVVPNVVIALERFSPLLKGTKKMKRSREDYLKLSDECMDILVSDLSDFVRIDSIYDESTIEHNAPYGKGVYQALQYIANLGTKHDFKVDCCDGHCTELSVGSGPVTIMVMGHADVVPVGNGWSDSPFSGKVEDGKLYGRGSIDDKGPTLAAFHALRILKEKNLLNPKKTYKLVVGGNEERGSNCLHYYFNELHKPAPDYGFTPDADFPVVYGEKGILGYEYCGNGDMGTLISLKGGVVANAVADFAEAHFKKDLNISEEFDEFITEHKLRGEYTQGNKHTKIIIHGKGAHASTPQLGVNALAKLLLFLSQNINNEVVKHFGPLFSEYDGSSAGIKFKGDKMGKLTMNLGLGSIENGHYSFVLNIRYPIETTGSLISNVLDLYKLDEGIVHADSKPLYVDPETPFIKSLVEAYQEISLDYDTPPLTIGGGTYARSTINSVAFGMGFPDGVELAHQADEYVELEELKKGLAIYLMALDSLGDL